MTKRAAYRLKTKTTTTYSIFIGRKPCLVSSCLFSHFKNIMGVEIEGLADLSQMLTELTPRAAKRYLSRCAEPAAQVVIDAMAETVPVGVGILEEELGWQKKWSNDGDETTMEINIGPLRPAFWGSRWSSERGSRPGGVGWAEPGRDAATALDVFATEAVGILQDLENKR